VNVTWILGKQVVGLMELAQDHVQNWTIVIVVWVLRQQGFSSVRTSFVIEVVRQLSNQYVRYTLVKNLAPTKIRY
jgi:hypothetical protein